MLPFFLSYFLFSKLDSVHVCFYQFFPIYMNLKTSNKHYPEIFHTYCSYSLHYKTTYIILWTDYNKTNVNNSMDLCVEVHISITNSVQVIWPPHKLHIFQIYHLLYKYHYEIQNILYTGIIRLKWMCNFIPPLLAIH